MIPALTTKLENKAFSSGTKPINTQKRRTKRKQRAGKETSPRQVLDNWFVTGNLKRGRLLWKYINSGCGLRGETDSWHTYACTTNVGRAADLLGYADRRMWRGKAEVGSFSLPYTSLYLGISAFLPRGLSAFLSVYVSVSQSIYSLFFTQTHTETPSPIHTRTRKGKNREKIKEECKVKKKKMTEKNKKGENRRKKLL